MSGGKTKSGFWEHSWFAGRARPIVPGDSGLYTVRLYAPGCECPSVVIGPGRGGGGGEGWELKELNMQDRSCWASRIMVKCTIAWQLIQNDPSPHPQIS